MSTPYQDSKIREKKLSDGLIKLAEKHGVHLRYYTQHYIDSKGEFDIIAEAPNTEYPKRGDACGKYGEAFAAVLSRYGPRTGALCYGYHKSCHADGGWCMMNHFEVERMLTDEGFYTPEPKKG